MTTASLQQATSQPPARPASPVDGDELARRIQSAVDQALSQAGTPQERTVNVQETIRRAVDEARAEVAAARAGQREIIIPPPLPQDVIPPQAVDISVAFFVMTAFVIVGLPLARAFARRMDRRGAGAPVEEIAPRLDRIEQAIEAIAIEVERVSEGQRFTTKAISELRGLPAAGWPAGGREGERVPAAAEAVRRP